MLLCMAGLLCFASPAGAVPFPEKTDEIVQDKDQYLSKEAVEHFNTFVKSFADNYKLVVVESTQPETQTPDEYAQKLYDNYNLDENTMMIVLDINTQQLGVYPGKALAAKGAKLEMLHEKIVAFYEPYRNQKEYAKGIEMFITETNKELDRIAKQTGAAPADTAAQAPAADTQPAEDTRPIWLSLPWWLYLIGFMFIGMLVLLVYSFIRRRQVFAEVDRVEDWKDQLVDKLHKIEVDKSLRRSSGSTEERYVQLANRKEHILRVRVPDVEMIILEAEEACDRFRFQMASGLLEEAEELLEQIEAEMFELKSDMTKVVQTKKESKLVLPEIGKLFEMVERKLDKFRLEYGMSFHELKEKLDEVERMRSLVTSAQASGDDVKAYETTEKAQAILKQLAAHLEKLPALFKTVQMEMPEELKEMEDGIAAVLRDGYDLSQIMLDADMLQANQLLSAAKRALEEGNLEGAATHAKAFRVKLDSTFQSIEETVLKQREANLHAQGSARLPEQAVAEEFATEPQAAGQDEALTGNMWTGEAEAAAAAATIDTLQATAALAVDAAAPQMFAPKVEAPVLTMEHSAEYDEAAAAASEPDIPQIVVEERHEQWMKKKQQYEEKLLAKHRAAEEQPAEANNKEAYDADVYETAGYQAEETELYQAVEEEEMEPVEEYELVIPKRHEEVQESYHEPPKLVIETEDDVLDELERISGVLIKVRQQIKRSYLPGIPDLLKYHFDQSVQLLGMIKSTMEKYQYDLSEVTVLLEEVNEFVTETENLAEKTIAECQQAEGAIQYTNRYRRQNPKVQALLQKAEQLFRQLSFHEAYELAEEARLLMEGEPEEPESRWILRKKKKG